MFTSERTLALPQAEREPQLQNNQLGQGRFFQEPRNSENSGGVLLMALSVFVTAVFTINRINPGERMGTGILAYLLMFLWLVYRPSEETVESRNAPEFR